MPLRALILGAIAIFAMGSCSAISAELAKPQGEVVLTISGGIEVTNTDGKATFDMEMLKAFPQSQFTTSTIWTEGTHTYSGVLLKDILEAVGAKGATLRAVAINDYAVEIPTSDAVVGGPIIATAVDGKPMSLRDKGPLWIIYPFDGNNDYRSETIYSRSIWQLGALEVSN